MWGRILTVLYTKIKKRQKKNKRYSLSGKNRGVSVLFL
jgi:hypothetical protein